MACLSFAGLCVIALVVTDCVRGEWWYLGVVGPYQGTLYGVVTKAKDSRSKRTHRCENMGFLVPRQKELCNQGEFMLDVISEGAALGISQCMRQFQDRRWNCSVFDTEDVFGKVLALDSRERAYVHSVSSAGVMHAITKACAKGEIGNCGCDTRVARRDTKGEFEWGGCSHNPDFGAKFSREFVDTKEDAKTSRGRMNLWNNEAGRQAVRKEMKTLCKCHGVSASCAIKICWRALSNFDDIGEHLKNAYDGAKWVRYENATGRVVPQLEHLTKPRRKDLVYLRDSPDFCEYDAEAGSLGTRGRSCNRTSEGLDKCSLLCCGRGYSSQVAEIEEDCNCRFVWCCRVECDRCRRRVEVNHCN